MPQTEDKTYTVPAPPLTVGYLLRAGAEAVKDELQRGLALLAMTDMVFGDGPLDPKMAEVVAIGKEKMDTLRQVLTDTADWSLACALSMEEQGYPIKGDPEEYAALRAEAIAAAGAREVAEQVAP